MFWLRRVLIVQILRENYVYINFKVMLQMRSNSYTDHKISDVIM